MAKWEQYEIKKQALVDRLYSTCKSSEEFIKSYDEGIQKIINLLNL